MEALVVADQHRNQYYSRVKAYGSTRYGGSPSRHFKDINCRSFQSVGGILPMPFKNLTSPVSKLPPISVPECSSYLRKTRSSSVKLSANAHPVDARPNKNTMRSLPTPIGGKSQFKELSFDDDGDDKVGLSDGNLSFSELWAGPTYSNSPPPSSLPIPKFSTRPKRTVSLDLLLSNTPVKVLPISKSAPASPSREVTCSTLDLFPSVDSATKTLRRILNLDVADEGV